MKSKPPASHAALRWAPVAIWLSGTGLAGCGVPSPRPTVDAYRRALMQSDTDTLARLHSGRQPALSDPERLAALKRAHPGLWRSATERAAGDIRAVRMTAEVRLTSGATVTLVRDGADWRIDGGTLWAPGAETPEAALQTLADGVAVNDLAAVRTVMPEALQGRFATDAALLAHLNRIRGRVTAAVARIGRIRPGIAVIDGARASIAYQGQRRVQFVWEAKRWRVLDVE